MRFEYIAFTIIRRSINGQAHSLAKESIHSGRDFIRYDFNILAYLNHDKISLSHQKKNKKRITRGL